MSDRILSVRPWRASLPGLLMITFAWIAISSQFASANAERPLTFKNVTVLFIDKKDCATCKVALGFLREIATKDKWLNIQTMQFETSTQAQRIHRMLLKVFNIEATDFPVTVVGSHAVMGYIDHRTTGMEIVGYANECRIFECADILEAIDQDDGAMVDVRLVGCLPRSSGAARTVTWASEHRNQAEHAAPFQVCQIQ